MENEKHGEESPEVNPKSIQLLLDTALNEYSNEHDRKSILQNWRPCLMKSIVSIPVNSLCSSLLPITLFLSYTGGLILSMLSVAFMAKVLFAKDYCRINPVDLYTDDNLTKQNCDFSISLMHNYFHAISYNREVNNKRVNTYQLSWKFAFISVILFVIYLITKNNF